MRIFASITKLILDCFGKKTPSSHESNPRESTSNFDSGDDAADGSRALITQTHKNKRLLLWKTWKSLRNITIPHQNKSMGEAVTFENKVFDEFAVETTAAIQFCVGNAHKIPLVIDNKLNQTMRAEGGRLDEYMPYVLQNVYDCVLSGRDLGGNKLICEELVPMIMRKDDFILHCVEEIFLYIESGWEGLCLLMVLKPMHRLYRNKNNAIVGIVVHNNHTGSARLMGSALNSLDINVKEIRALLYQFKRKSNSYVEAYGKKKSMDIIQETLSRQRLDVVFI
jgi:hypothetical protein